MACWNILPAVRSLSTAAAESPATAVLLSRLTSFIGATVARNRPAFTLLGVHRQTCQHYRTVPANRHTAYRRATALRLDTRFSSPECRNGNVRQHRRRSLNGLWNWQKNAPQNLKYLTATRRMSTIMTVGRIADHRRTPMKARTQSWPRLKTATRRNACRRSFLGKGPLSLCDVRGPAHREERPAG